MNHHIRRLGNHAFTAFVITVVLAFSAAAASLLPDNAHEAADAVLDVNVNIEQIFPVGTFDI